jgi:hypothetical protein
MFTLSSNNCLIKNCIGEHGRHNFSFKGMFSSGNVIYNCTGKDSRYSSDFHMHLSMANLFDNFHADSDFLEAKYRPWGTIIHGQTTTQSVYWNTFGINKNPLSKYLINSQQLGWGYVIGTQGNSTEVFVSEEHNTSPPDFVEGVGKGNFLKPESLYKDQLEKRLKIKKTSKKNKNTRKK